MASCGPQKNEADSTRFHPYPTQEVTSTTRSRKCSNLKERKRNLAINDAFSHLQTLIPFVPEPTESKLPKIKTLRLAVSYIGFLNQLLENDSTACNSTSLQFNSPQSNFIPFYETRPRTATPSDFAQVVASEIQSRNSYKERAEQLLQNSPQVSETNEDSKAMIPLPPRYPISAPAFQVQPQFPFQCYW